MTSVTQIGTDRVIEIQFSDGQYRLFLEFFAAGNVVLTDKDFNILALLRVVSEGSEDVDVKLGSTYSLKAKQNYNGVPPLSEERIRAALIEQVRTASALPGKAAKKPKKKREGEDVRKALTSGFPEYPNHLIEHAFNKTGFDPTSRPEQILEDSAAISKLFAALEEADRVFNHLSDNEQLKGYIIATLRNVKGIEKDEEPGSQGLLYDDFHPFRPIQFENKEGVRIVEIDGFNKTADEFFSSLESQKLESRLTEREEHAKRKLKSARQEHEKRLGVLQQVQELHIRQAEAITINTHRVQEAIDAVNGLIAQGMDWGDIAKLVENEQKRENPVAKMIRLPLKLYENTVTLLLAEASTEEENEDSGTEPEEDSADSGGEGQDTDYGTEKRAEQSAQFLAIDIDLALTPWANASNYYDQKKSAAEKEQKTVQASVKALKNAENKIAIDLKKGLQQEKQVLQPTRKSMWFEKFLFFISSEGYLVLGGKDGPQNEILYRRYLKKGDVYVHADLQGAASVIVKNTVATPDAPIPPSTLSQAGALSVCTSSAWDSKAVMAAWWVHADQVSKTAPTGEYISTGGFMIRGKKNFLPPSQLLLGFAVMFQISEDSKKNHNRHRLQHVQSEEEKEQRLLTDSADSKSAHDTESDEADEETIEEAEPPDSKFRSKDNSRKAESDSSDDDEEIDSDAEATHSASNPLQTDSLLATKLEPTEPATPLAESEGIPETEFAEHKTKDGNPDRGNAAVEEDAKQLSKDSSDPTVKRHLTARERRLLHQGKPLPAQPTSAPETAQTSENDAEHSDKDDNATDAPSDIASSTTAATPASKTQPLTRGKRTKAKRAAQKYAAQDAEDRALAMALLGSHAQQQKKTEQEADRIAQEEKLQRDKERRRAQHERAAAAERRRLESGRSGGADEEGPDQDPDPDNPDTAALERQELLNLDALVGWPMPGDEILAAIPVCAPWAALAGRCKYKVKLQPGSVKKGKAVREILGRWTELGKAGPKVVDERAEDRERVWLREVECLRAWRVEECVGGVPVGKVRVMLGGGMGGGGNGGGKGRGKGGGARGGKGSKKAR